VTELRAELKAYGISVSDALIMNVGIPDAFDLAIQKTEIVKQNKEAYNF
jgi:hypothetical protein